MDFWINFQWQRKEHKVFYLEINNENYKEQ